MQSSKPSSIFDNSAHLSWIKTPTCPCCLMEYVVTKPKEKVRRPYLLPCSHSICDKCLMPQINFVKCVDCQSVVKIDRSKHMRAQFDFNYFLYGMLLYMEQNLHYELEYFYQHTNLPMLQTYKKRHELCCECLMVQTNQMCTTCQGYYCHSCFMKVHSMANALKNHKLTKIDGRVGLASSTPSAMSMLERADEIMYCRKHPSDELCFFCVDCQIQICEECKFVHQQHQLSRIVLDNRKALPKLREIIAKLKKGKNKIMQAQQDANIAVTRLGLHASTSAVELTAYFSEIHGELQNIEKGLLMILRNDGIEQAKGIIQHQEQLSHFEKRLEDEIKQLSGYASNLPQTKYLFDVIDDASVMLDKIEQQALATEFYNENPFRSNFSKKAIYQSLIQNLINKSGSRIAMNMNNNNSFAFNQNQMINAINSANWKQKGWNNDKANQSKEGYATGTKSKNGNFMGPKAKDGNFLGTKPNDESASGTKAKDGNFSATKGKKMRKPQHQSISNMSDSNSTLSNLTQNTNNFNSNSVFHVDQELVRISHIKNPTHFYVHRNPFLHAIDKFVQACQREACVALKPVIINLNTVYLVWTEKLNLWYRGQAICKMNSAYQVFYVDYGNEEVVPMHRIREISAELRSRPYGATICSLYNIEPAQEQWKDDATQVMSEMILRSTVTMLIVAEDEINSVDLIISSGEYKTSIRDTLVYLGMALKTTPKTQLMAKKIRYLDNFKEKALVPRQKRNFTQYRFREGDIFKVKIVNVVSPGEFYIFKIDYKDEYEKLDTELNEFYDKDDKNLVFLPHVDMVCSVRYNDKWNRGRIIHILANGMCDIWLVDLGILRKISWKCIRALEERFLKISEAVVNCCLQDIYPIASDYEEWSHRAIEEFKLLAQHSDLRVLIGMMRDRQYHVLLNITMKDLDICINGRLVKMGLAKSRGTETANAEFVKDSLLDDIEEALSRVRLPQKPKMAKSSLRTMVSVLNVISPDEFYIRVLRHGPSIDRMHMEIQNEPLKMPTPEYIWHASDSCYARAKIRLYSNKYWYRAVILDIDETKYNVYLKDFGFTVNVEFDDLAIIDPIVANIGSGAVQCHLACVKPTGGNSTWTQSAQEEFHLATTKFEGYGVSLQGEHRGDSKSVILWGMTNDCSDPLAPSFYEWTNINNLLVQRGFVHLTRKFEPIIQNDSMESQIAPGLDDLDTWLKSKLNAIVDRMKTIDLTANDECSGSVKEIPPIPQFRQISTEYELDDIYTPIKCWLEAEPLKKSIFMGIPTYVDNNAVIYLYDVGQTQLYKEMKYVINHKLKKNDEKSLNDSFKEGDPCMALFHMDNLFYRAVVLKVKSKNKYKVQFVDYGNIETCTKDELRKYTIFGHIPIQIKKIYLANIKPMNTNTVWPMKVLDFIHQRACDKLCSVRVVEPDYQNLEYVPVTLTINGTDISDELKSLNLAEHSETNILTKADILFDPSEDSPAAGSSNSTPVHNAKTPSPNSTVVTLTSGKQRHFPKFSDCGKDPLLTLDDYEEIFHGEDLKKFVKTIDKYLPKREKKKSPPKFETMSAYGIEDGDDDDNDVDDNKSNQFVTWYEQIELCKKDIDEYSSVSQSGPYVGIPPTEGTIEESVLNSIVSPVDSDKIKLMTLDPAIDCFQAKTNYLLDSTNLLIEPHLDAHRIRLNEMTKQIQIAAKLKAYAVDEIEIGMVCLARYKVDGQFYRAIVREYDIVSNHVRVIFVDYINVEIVPACDIRRCPTQFLEIPLQNIQVKLFGIRRNPRLRENDVERKLGELLQDNVVNVKVIQRGDVPLVKLYDDGDSEFVIYQDLISDRYYLPSK